MTYTQKYLADCKRKLGIESDYALAKSLGLSRAMVSEYQNTGRTMSDATAIRVAELLDIEPREVFAAMQVDRAQSDVQRKAWEWLYRAAKKAAGAAASVALGAALIGPSPQGATAKASADHCVLRQIRRRKRTQALAAVGAALQSVFPRPMTKA